jgi:anthranilate phosphoribosyltransferase
LDELSLEAGNEAILVEQGSALKPIQIEASALGLAAAPVSALRGGDASENAAHVRAVLSGDRGPRRNAVVLNAAAALWVAGRSASLEEAARVAAESLDSGAAANTLARYIAASQAGGEE